LVTADGGELDAQITASVLLDSSGNPAGVIAVICDVTERRRMEETLRRAKDELEETVAERTAELAKANEELRESESHFRSLLESSPDAIAVVDLTGQISECNRVAAEMFGFSRKEEMIGRRGIDLVAPENRWKAIDGRADRLTDEQAGTGEITAVAVDARRFQVEVHSRALKGPSGTPISIVAIYRDITDRKRADKISTRRTRFFESLVELSSEGATVLNRDLSLRYKNAALRQILGCSDDGTSGMTGFDFIHPEDIDKAMTAISEVLQNPDQVKTVELRVRHQDGTWLWEECTTKNLIVNPDVEGIVMTLRDIDERKHAEEEQNRLIDVLEEQNQIVVQFHLELEATQKELAALNNELEERVPERSQEVERLLRHKDELIWQLGHDLKSPLTPMLALLPMVIEDEQDEHRKEVLEALHDNAVFMKDLVTKTLTLAKLNSVSDSPSEEGVSLAEAVRRVLEVRGTAIAQKGITVSADVEDSLLVKTAETALQDVLDNLVMNAVKFTPEGGTITVRAVRTGEDATASITDAGIGMTKEQLSHIFDEFYKADLSRHDLDACGLGLPICKRIIERYGGRIWAESPGLRQGSTVYFTLKLTVSRAETEEAAA
jgi:PAS domain S-box-containing protein